MLTTLRRFARARLEELKLPAVAKAERHDDRTNGVRADPGIESIDDSVLQWLAAAQDQSATKDGGAARHFSLITGWGSSYPETSGYIVPTLIDAGVRRGDPSLVDRARVMLDWLTSIQFPEGGFQGGTIGQTPRVPVTFNTGQILMGLAAGTRQFGSAFEEPMHRAATWLVETMDADGCWRRYPTPFAAPGEKTYETHVGWGLIEAARATPDARASNRYVEAALRNARWALTHQHPNGWFDRCCLEVPEAPLTHTIGYVFRGLIEIFLYTRDPELLAAAKRLANAIVGCVGSDGRMPGRFDSSWRPTVPWVCLTGSAQIAHSLLLLYQETAELRYRDAAFLLLSYVRRRVKLDAPDGIRGGVKGSFPVDGDYGSYQFLNWAAKFLVDANQLEKIVRKRD